MRQEISAFIAEQEALGHLLPGAGIAVSVLSRGEVIFEDGFGLRDRAIAAPVTADTIFQVSSMTKGVTAAAFVLAAQRGLIDLDARIASMSGTALLGNAGLNAQLTVIDLLSHRAALPANDCLWLFGCAGPADLAQRLQYLEFVPDAFRKAFIYNNSTYSALAVLFASNVGQSLEDFVSRNILVPLQMGATRFADVNAVESPDIAQGYAGQTPLKTRDVTSIQAAGGLRSSLRDISRWLTFQLNGGQAQAGEPTLSQQSFEAMRAERISVENTGPFLLQGLEWLGPGCAYGLGWFLGRVHGHQAVYHPGFIDGFSTAVVMLPSLGIGITVLTNVNMSPTPGLLAQRLVNTLLGRELTSAEPSRIQLPSVPSSVPGLAQDGIVGTYAEPAYGCFEISSSVNGLVLKYQRAEWPIALYSRDAAGVAVEMFGLTIPVPLQFVWSGERVKRILIPLSMDPRVGPQVFSRLE